MSITNKNILLACYDFPPNQGIGGRRWSKFARQLADFGYTIHVIKANPIKNNQESAWTPDIVNENIRIHSLARKYPQIISHPEGGILNKIKYKYHLHKLELKNQGTIYDIAIGWEKVFIGKAQELIDTFEIINVIATGAPFNLIYYTSKLKDINPQVNIICDYRDPWITAQNYGMATLETNRKKIEIRKQTKVYTNANFISCPNEFMLKEIKESEPDQSIIKAEFIPIPHFYDQNDTKSFKNYEEKTDDKIRFVYGGALYLGLDKYLENISGFLDQLKKKIPSVYSKCVFDFYTDHHEKKKYFTNHTSIVQFHKPVGKEIFNHIAKADFLLVLLAKHNKDFKTTKFFEYLPFKKPMAYFGPDGEVSKFIIKNKLGYSIHDFENDFLNIFEEYNSGFQSFDKIYDETPHSLEEVTKKLCTLFK